MKKFLYFLSGANSQTLTQRAENDYQRLLLGSSVLCTGLLAGLSGGYASWLTFGFGPLAIVFGVIWGMVVTGLVTASMSWLESSRGLSRLFSLIPVVLLALIVALTVSIPIEMRLFEAEINKILASSISQSQGFIARYHAYQDLRATSSAFAWGHWAVTTLFAVITTAPILMKLLLPSRIAEAQTAQRKAGEAERLSADLQKHIEEVLRAQREFIEAALKLQRVKPGAYKELSLPSFGSGFASAMDWFGDLAPTIEEFRGGDRTLDEARDAAIARDWAVIGQDLQRVLDRHGEKAA